MLRQRIARIERVLTEKTERVEAKLFEGDQAEAEAAAWLAEKPGRFAVIVKTAGRERGEYAPNGGALFFGITE